MNTPIKTALKVTCSMMFAVATSGILPATAHAAKPAASTSNSAHHRNANAYEHGSKQDKSIAQPVAVTPQPAVSSATTVTENSTTQSSNLKSETSYTANVNDPSRNNGFIKINEEIMPDSIPNNDPHVGCNLKVEFYNFDKNPNYRAHVSFALHSPTVKAGQTMSVVGNTNPFIGEDAAGGGNDLDAAHAYKLSFTGTPHAKQGYHVKLTVHADGSRGSDVKHKVFWVQPCAQPGQVLPASTNSVTTAGKTLSTNTIQASSVLPSKLPSTGMNFVPFIVTMMASVLTYAGAMVFQIHKLRRI